MSEQEKKPEEELVPRSASSKQLAALPPEPELVVIHIKLPRPMTFQETFGFDPKTCQIDWSSCKYPKSITKVKKRAQS